MRLLIVAGAAAASVDQLPQEVRDLIEGATEVLVVAPVLASKLHLWTNDTDRAREHADERLAAVVGDVEAIDSEAAARGVVGDEVPLQAFDDAVRTFEPDHILIGLRAGDAVNWQEQQLVERVREAFELPVTVIEIDEDGQVWTFWALVNPAAEVPRMTGVALDEVRAIARELPRSYEVFVQGRVKFRVGRIVYLAFARDETLMGFAFPKEWREALVESEPEKFLLPKGGDLRYNWAVVRLGAIDAVELRELVLDAWAMVVPRSVAAAYAELDAPG